MMALAGKPAGAGGCGASGGSGSPANAGGAGVGGADATAFVAIQQWFETLTPTTLTHIGSVYAEQAVFKDPFQQVQGVVAIQAIFARMFEQLQNPRFVVLTVVSQGQQGFLTWDLRFGAPRLGPGEQVIHGASHLQLDAQGRIVRHRDYWDAAEELYEKVPGLGVLMRWLKRRAGH